MLDRCLAAILLASALSLFSVGGGPAEEPPKRDIVPVLKDKKGQPEERARKGRRFAILIGIDDYPHVGKLSCCESDMTQTAKILEKHCGYAQKDILLLINEKATLAHLREEIPRFLKWVELEDTLLFSFSGHGFLSDGRGYLAAFDCKQSNLAATGMPTREVRKLLEDCKAVQKLLILDCCHAGGRGAGDSASSETVANEFKASSGLLTIASSKANQKSHEWEEKRHGVFTYFLLEGLQGKADANKDGQISSDELFDFTQKHVADYVAEKKKVNPKFADQQPVRIAFGEVPNYILAVSKTKPEGLEEPRRVGPIKVGSTVEITTQTTGYLTREATAAHPAYEVLARGSTGTLETIDTEREVYEIKLTDNVKIWVQQKCVSLK